MYDASTAFKNAIKSNVRKLQWNGSISGSGFSKDFVQTDVLSCSITKSISGNTLDIGTVYASQITAELVLDGVSRYELYGKQITVRVRAENISDNILMGTFTITEATQSADRISIKGYDDMVKFEDVEFSPSKYNKVQSPFKWLVDACNACGVPYGFIERDIRILPNGDRDTGFANVVSDAKTWRDVLSYICSYLGSYAYIDRYGSLYVGHYKANADDTIPATFRFSSELSDFRTTYDGLYCTNKESGVQEYVGNANTNGIVLDLGTNPFLQFTKKANRMSALQEIADSWNGIYYVPYESKMPLNPLYDAGDVLQFTGNQAGEYDIGVITEISYNDDGSMDVKCGGDNPKLMKAQDRFSKTVAGLSSDYNNGQSTGGKDFWMLLTENEYMLNLYDAQKILVDQIEWEQSVDVQRIGLMFTAQLDITDTSTVELELTVDDSFDYRFDVTEEKLRLGSRIINATCAWRVKDKGNHVAKVFMKVTKNPLLWSDMA